jgi:recombination protein RecT
MANPTQALAKPDSRGDIRGILYDEKMQTAIRAVLPRHLTVDRMVKVALGATMKNPTLLQCSRESFMLAIIQAAELGLEPGGALGHAYLVPFRGANGYECQLIPGYRGLIALARRSGEIVSLEAHSVFQRDQFRVAYGLAPVLEHVPFMPEYDEAGNVKGDPNPGPLVAVYAVAKLRDGGTQIELMPRAEVDAIKKRSQTGRNNSGPWATDYSEMARKTVVRRLFKYLPVSIELANALELQARAEGDEHEIEAPQIDGLLPKGEPAAAPTRADDLKNHLDATQPPANNPGAEPARAREPGDDDGDDEPPPAPTGTDAPAGGAPTAEASAPTPAPPAKARGTGPKASAEPLTEAQWIDKLLELRHREHALNLWKRYLPTLTPDERPVRALSLARAMKGRGFAYGIDDALAMLGEPAGKSEAA